MKDLKGIQAKVLFENKLKQSGLEYTIIRPTGFFSDMQDFFKMAQKGRVFVFGSGDNKINPIHGADLAEVCVNALKKPEKDINVGGPELFTFKEIAELAFQVLNKKEKISTLPMWMIRITLPFNENSYLIQNIWTVRIYDDYHDHGCDWRSIWERKIRRIFPI